MAFVTRSRAVNAFSLLCALAAFILSILCLFAGSPAGFLDEGSMLTVNMSRIGQTPLFDSVNTTNCKRQFLDGIRNGAGEVIDSIGDKADCIINKGKGKINDLVSDLSDSIADALNLPDFFDLHEMNFCIGKFEPADYLDQYISTPERNITYCSPKTTEFSLDLTEYVREALPSGVTLEDIHWPEEIPQVEAAIKTASRATVIFYAIGVGSAGLCAIVSLWNMLHESKVAELTNIVMSILGFFALMIGGAASTVVSKKAANAINDHGSDIGIEAVKGGIFLGMTWAAVVLMVFVLAVALGQILGRRKQKSSTVARSKV